MPQEHDLPIRLIELLDGCGKPPLQLPPGGRRGRREFPVGQPFGEIGLLVIASTGHHQRHLAVETAARGHAMPAVGIDQPVPGHVPQPEPKRHRGIGKIIAEPAVRLDEHILHDVAGVHPPLHHPIHAQVDHPADRGAVPLEEPVDGVAVSLTNAIQEHERYGRIG